MSTRCRLRRRFCFMVVQKYFKKKSIACYLIQNAMKLSQNRKGDENDENDQHQIGRFDI